MSFQPCCSGPAKKGRKRRKLPDWLLLPCTSCYTMEDAVKKGHVRCLAERYASETATPSPMVLSRLAYLAVSYHRLQCLQLLHECSGVRKLASSGVVMTMAVSGGNLSILRYLHERGHAWPSYTTTNLVVFGDLRMLRYADEHGCPWKEITTYMAALYGRLKCLRYAKQRGHFWHPETTHGFVETRFLPATPASHRCRLEGLRMVRAWGPEYWWWPSDDPMEERTPLCLVLLEGCQLSNCTNCRSSPLRMVRPLLQRILQSVVCADVVDLVCAFACEEWPWVVFETKRRLNRRTSLRLNHT